MLKKNLCVGFLFFMVVCASYADDLAELLQDLAVQTACLGRYSSAETGVIVTSRYDDPPDWYEPPLLANRFAAMSGNMTRINTFYGVCFDYAQFAWEDIKKYQAAYNRAGMKGQQWYIAAANANDPYTIILYDPVSREKATTISNGVYLKENSRRNVYTHDGASGHAWLWVQDKNDKWYWIDPTWTDNTGYVWWGIVENGKEVTYYPDAAYCVASNYPRPPRQGETPSERATRSPNSTYAEFIKYTPQFDNAKISIGLYAGYVSALDFDFANKYGFSIGLEDHVPYNFGLVGSLSLDYLENKVNDKEQSIILGAAAGFQMFTVLVVYAGGGVGVKFPMDNGWFAWKVNGGLRVQIKRFFTKLDVSYNPIIGPALGANIGIFF
jgi:hypothetical protein